MPSSYYHNIPKILDIIIKINPNSVLDVGCGFGKYGVLMREYLDLGDNINSYHNQEKKIDCVEAYSRYITNLHGYIYSHIFVESITNMKFLYSVRDYDLIFMVDVLEHLTKVQGKRAIEELFLLGNKGILISMPRYEIRQKESFGNKNEEHKSFWTKADLKEVAEENWREIVFYSDSLSIICYIGTKEQVRELKKMIRRKKIKNFISSIPIVNDFYFNLK